MLHHYILTTWRQFVRNPLFSAINITGLAVGMAICLLIGQYITYEVSYDQFYPQKERLFRVWMEKYQNGELQTSEARTYPAISGVLVSDISGVESSIRTTTYTGSLLAYQKSNQWQAFPSSRICTAEPDILKIFPIELIEGNPDQALNEPFKILICESYAKQYFPHENPLGKLIQEDGEEQFEITGVFKDFPPNSTLEFQFIKSYSSLAQHFYMLTGQETDVPTQSWDWPRIETFVKLSPQAKPQQIEEMINDILVDRRNNANEQIDERLFLQPISDMHLYSERNQAYMENNSHIEKLGFLLLIAVIILLLAWMNYINLTAARATMRAKEVGVRKTLGASKQTLTKQFLLESIALNFVASIFALTLFQICRNSFNEYFDIARGFSLFANWQIWALLMGIFFLGSILTSLYPAYVLTSFRVSNVLKGIIHRPEIQIIPIRKALAVFQFATTFILVAGTLGVYMQLQFMQKQNLGMDLSQIVVIKGPRAFDYDAFSANPNIIKQELLKLPSVLSVSSSYSVPANGMSAYELYRMDIPERKGRYYSHEVDHNFIDVYDIKLIAGRNFSQAFATDDSAVLINERALHQFGFSSPEEALGKRISTPEEGYLRHIIGIVKDFHHQSLHHEHWPMTLSLDTESRGFYSIKIIGNNYQESISAIEQVFSTSFPGNTFEYFFADEHFAHQYESDRRFGYLFATFAMLALLVASLGLLGLATLLAFQKRKEIGIRKVLGATLSHIFYLLTKGYASILLIAMLIGIPISIWGLKQWLSSFAFRMDLSIWIFILPIIFMSIIAFVTISWQTIQAAMQNPVEALREE